MITKAKVPVNHSFMKN